MKPKQDARTVNGNPKMKRVGLTLIGLLLISIIMPSTRPSTQPPAHYEDNSSQHIISAENPDLNLSYTSRTRLFDTPVKSGDTIAGDHVVLKAEWTPSLVVQTRLEINAHAIPTILALELNQPTLEIDTRALGNNASCTITSTAWLLNGSIIVVEFTNVYIGNFFVPKVRVISPNGGEDWSGIHNITWVASDVNADAALRFDVLFSADRGTSFETLISSINRTWFEWDCSELDRLDTYIVRIRVTDGIYYNADSSDALFTAGSPTTTTTSPTTTTPTTPSGLEPRIIAFIVLLLFSSAIMALVVYYAARKWV